MQGNIFHEPDGTRCRNPGRDVQVCSKRGSIGDRIQFHTQRMDWRFGRHLVVLQENTSIQGLPSQQNKRLDYKVVGRSDHFCGSQLLDHFVTYGHGNDPDINECFLDLNPGLPTAP